MVGALQLSLTLVEVLYLFAPVLLSAALSALVMRRNWLSALYVPVDGGLQLGGRPLFGRTKTWRGFVVAVLGCILGAAFQRYLLAPYMRAFELVDYARLDVVPFGMAMGLGAMLGELPNLFVKRRLGIGSGDTTEGVWSAVFYVWDQIDLLTLTWPLISPWVEPTLPRVLGSFALALVLHPLSSWIGFVLGARQSAR